MKPFTSWRDTANWRTRDFRINPEHPPLAKLVAALPALAINQAGYIE
jgi:hypothetical protein